VKGEKVEGEAKKEKKGFKGSGFKRISSSEENRAEQGRDLPLPAPATPG
jgi:hypothetical protein